MAHPLKKLKVDPYPLVNAVVQTNVELGIADPGAMELTDDEVVALIEKFGFSIIKRESRIPTPYIQDTESMMQNTYLASHWVARKM